jgi:hypothetical protein
MSDQRAEPDQGRRRYEVRILGHLDDRWSDWFDGARISRETDGTTVIRADAADQAALHGLLQKVRDVGLPLISVVGAPPVRRGYETVEPGGGHGGDAGDPAAIT